MASGEQLAFNRCALGVPVSALRVRSGASAGEQKAFRRAAVGLPVATLTVASLGATTYASDSFDRANSSSSLGTADIGGAWTAQQQTWGIQTNKAYIASGSTRCNATLAVGQLNVSVSADFTMSAGPDGTFAGLIGRYNNDDANYIRCYLAKSGSGGANDIILQQELAGSGSALASVSSAGLADGATYNLKLVFSGSTCAVYLDGVLKIAATAFNSGLTATNYGLGAYVSGGFEDGGSRWNNFLVTS